PPGVPAGPGSGPARRLNRPVLPRVRVTRGRPPRATGRRRRSTHIGHQEYVRWQGSPPPQPRSRAMRPTDVSDPAYYHRVVDCQWACPAHTNVPEYIRLIAQGRYTEAYLLNRESNVFPGILGRTCDRPCEPACRRTRVEGSPVA